MTNRQMAEIIRNREPVVLPPGATVQEACHTMDHRHIGAILVTDAHGKLVGIFTGRDAVHVLATGKDGATTHLSSVMTRRPQTMGRGHTAIEALRLMRDGGFRHIPVVEGDKPIGVVSRGDFRGLERDRLDEETGYWEHMR